ncbi:MAG: protocatechuate 3,4-dioxygenase [Acidobacteria bacterium]|nr:protocatechuate 3,4-dioxygenase [Acidobacteriota bacterium]MBI3424033.1 protocatechuate 3,4-dioxygenase [Acidobacteriota bacterium]
MKLFALLMVFSLSLFTVPQAPTVAEKNAPSKITIATKEEPGERLTVSGVIFGADGKTPLANASVYVYHTDVNGHYTPGPKDDNRNPRLRGYMRTDAQGRYEYSTIKPAPYPGNGPPAHIHYHVNAPGYQERVFEIVFEGDPKISADIRTRAAQEDSAFSIRPLAREAQGGWRCTQNVTLRK